MPSCWPAPPYPVPTDRENALKALAINKAADLPAMLYNYPHRTDTMMGAEFLDRVGRAVLRLWRVDPSAA